MSNPYSPNMNKTLSQVIDSLKNSINVNIHCVKIGEIVSFDKTDQTASVKVLHVLDSNYDLYMDEGVTVEYPVLGKVPVVIMGGGGTYITHPIAPGDHCLLLFCDYMIDSWWATGEAKPSLFPRKHDISDPIAIVGLNPIPKAIQNYSDYLRLQYNENSSIVIGEQIDVNNATTNLNGNVNVQETLTAKTLNATSAASGTFTTADSKTVTVVNGIITKIQ